MPEIIIIVAVAKNNVIGNKGQIPWYIKDDFKHFKQKTLGHPCIMGDVTYESLPKKPLPGRENIVLTFNKDYHPEGASVFYSFEQALKHCQNQEKVFIIGGASIYKQAMSFANTLEITKIGRDFEGDTYFPEIKAAEWELVGQVNQTHEKYGPYSFLTYKRK
ncbi:MAG: dihydrofolate reductase [Pseudomonadota bacterium]